MKNMHVIHQQMHVIGILADKQNECKSFTKKILVIEQKCKLLTKKMYVIGQKMQVRAEVDLHVYISTQ